MSFVNEIAFKERVNELDIDGEIEIGGNIYLKGEFPKMNAMMELKTDKTTTSALTTEVGLKANRAEVDSALDLKANKSYVDVALAFTGEQNATITSVLYDEKKDDTFMFGLTTLVFALLCAGVVLLVAVLVCCVVVTRRSSSKVSTAEDTMRAGKDVEKA